MQETQVQSKGWEEPLEKEMATHSSTLAGIFTWTEGPGGLGSQRVGDKWVTAHAHARAHRQTDRHTHTHTHTHTHEIA